VIAWHESKNLQIENRRWEMRIRLMAIMVLVLMLALPGTLLAQQSDPEALARSVFEALNAGDVEAALALYADDAVLDLGAFGKFSGMGELRAAFEHEVSLHASWELSDFQVEGNTATFKSRYTSVDMDALGVTLEATEVITVQDGKITTDTWTVTEESMAALQAAMATLPVTGGGIIPFHAVVMALGGLAVVGGLGTKLRCRR
jgi:ketosteroid isomerase-like protein